MKHLKMKDIPKMTVRMRNACWLVRRSSVMQNFYPSSSVLEAGKKIP